MLNEWLLFNTKWENLHLYHGENKLLSMNEDNVRFALDQHAGLNLYSASSLKQQFAGNMSLHSDTLSWFGVNKSLLLLLKVVCLEKNQQNMAGIFIIPWKSDTTD